jgi:type VI secretion system protein VasJ
MAFSQHDEIVALGRDPISTGSPAGDPCRYEESFERLQAQLDRLGSLTGEEVSWPTVVELATGVLKTKSKDLLVMTYLTVGLFEQHGYGGLAAGLEAYATFLKNFWEKCYPKVKPPQGRYNAVQYLADRILPQIELKGGQCKKQPGAGDKEVVHKCAGHVEALVKTAGEAFAQLPESPNLGPLARAFKALQEKVGPLTAPAPAPGEAAGAAAGAPAGPAEAAGRAPAAAGVPEPFATATQAVEVVVRVAKYLLAQDNKDPRPYRLTRAVHFGGLVSAPKDGLLPGVLAPRRQYFEKLATAGSWPELLTEGEGQFIVTPLWLDLQRYIATALKNLGPAYGAAHQVVALDAVALHARLPGLFDVTFRDKTPFADGATKAWLDDARGQFGGGGTGAGARTEKDGVAAAVAEARKLLVEAKPADAVARLSAAANESADRRQRFCAQLALARMLADMNRPNLATPLLEELERQVDAFKLEEWEPALAAEVFENLYETFRKARPKPTPEDVQRTLQIFGRLCRVSPSAALKLDGAAAKT